MISFIKEGQILRVGLNVKTHIWPWPWLSFTWAWYDAQTHNMSAYRIRFRTRVWPFVYCSSSCWNIVDSYLFDTGQKLVSMELYEDAVIPYLKEQPKETTF